MKRIAFLAAGAALSCGCHPRDVRHVERIDGGFSVQVSAQCGGKGLSALFERTARSACNGDYRVRKEQHVTGHMWGNFAGECMVPERTAEIECVKESKQ